MMIKCAFIRNKLNLKKKKDQVYTQSFLSKKLLT